MRSLRVVNEDVLQRKPLGDNNTARKMYQHNTNGRRERKLAVQEVDENDNDNRNQSAGKSVWFGGNHHQHVPASLTLSQQTIARRSKPANGRNEAI